MAAHYVIDEYIGSAIAQAEYNTLSDGTFVGRIPACKGVIALGSTLYTCKEELHATLADWLLVGFRLGHSLPVINDIDLNKE